VPKVTDASKHHGNAGFIRRGNYLVISNRSARLDNSADTSFSGIIDAIAEGKKRVRGHNGAGNFKSSMLSFDSRNAR
jgi:hypothetical protein